MDDLYKKYSNEYNKLNLTTNAETIYELDKVVSKEYTLFVIWSIITVIIIIITILTLINENEINPLVMYITFAFIFYCIYYIFKNIYYII